MPLRRKPGSLSWPPELLRALALKANLDLSRAEPRPRRRTRESLELGELSSSGRAGTPATIPCRVMGTPSHNSPLQRGETWLWTGPVGHLLGGTLDFLAALTRYGLKRARGRASR